MRVMLSSRRLLAAAVLLAAAAARPAAAQGAALPATVRPAAAGVEPRPVAVYRFAATPSLGLPAEVTVADSAGTLVAHFRLPNDRQTRPMMVVLLGDDIILQGETPQGVLTLELREQREAGPRFVGRWHLENRGGELRGRFGR